MNQQPMVTYLLILLVVTFNTLGDYAVKRGWYVGAMITWLFSGTTWLQVLRRAPVGFSSVLYSILTVLTSLALGILILHEPMTLRLAIGATLVIVALVVMGPSMG